MRPRSFTATSRNRNTARWAVRLLWGCFAVLLFLLVWQPQARAQGSFFAGTRPMGMGGAMRGLATGDAGPTLNPSGISLMRAYSLESGYQYGKSPGSHDVRVSAVDSTSGFNLGGALYYAYHRDTPTSGITESGHVVGGSLSFPFLEKIFLGANVKYLYFRDAADSAHSGVTVDAGVTVRPLPQLSVGAAGYNLVEVATSWVPTGVGGGAVLVPMAGLLFAFDTVWMKVYDDPSRDHAISYMGGGELSFAATAAIRAGGGRDGLTRNGYISAGLTALSAELGAIDLGIRQDLSGEKKNTLFGVTARLFVPAI